MRPRSVPGTPSDLDDGARQLVALEDRGVELLAQIDLRLGSIGRMRLELHDLESQVVEGAAHLVELVLGLDDDFVEAVLVGPGFLFLAQGAEEPLAAPVAPRPANPGVEDLAIVEADRAIEAPDQIRQLRDVLVGPDFMTDLVGHRARSGWARPAAAPRSCESGARDPAAARRSPTPPSGG